MAGYIGSKAVLLSTTAAVVTGDMTVAGATTLSGAFTSLGIDDNATSTAITIDASKNVGIGTSSPSVNLHVLSSGDTIARVTSADGSGAFLDLGDASDPDGGRIVYDSGSNLTFSTASTERMRINASGDVGINTASPDRPVHLSSSGSRNYFKAETTGATNASESGFEIKTPSSNWLINSLGGSDALIFYDLGNTSERMRIDGATGNVGINTASPGEALHVIGTIQASANFQLTANDSYCGFSANGMYVHNANDIMSFKTGAVERLRIDASGNVLVNATSGSSTDTMTIARKSGSAIKTTTGTSGNVNHIIFQNSNGAVGSIRTNGSATSYSVSSDYRLKENVTPIQGAADIVKAMRPCTYNFKADTNDWHDGFLAHELQEVHPRAVSGTKDAMLDEEYEVTPAVYEDVVTPAVDAVAATYDDEGHELTPAVEAVPETTESTLVTEAVTGTRSVPDMQGVDYSKLTPILTAALQEALTEIAALKVRVAALEVTP